MSLRRNILGFGQDAIRDPRGKYELRIERDLAVRYDTEVEFSRMLTRLVTNAFVEDEPYEDELLALKHEIVEGRVRLGDLPLNLEEALVLRSLLPEELVDQ